MPANIAKSTRLMSMLTGLVLLTVSPALAIKPLPPYGEPPKSHTVDPLPPLYVDPPVPKGSQSLTVTAALAGATSVSLAVSGEGCGTIVTQNASADSLTQTATAGASGSCLLTATFDTPSGTRTEDIEFEVEPTVLILPGIALEDGYFQTASLPDETNSGADPTIASIQAPDSLTAGSSGQLTITPTDPSGISSLRSIFVQIQGAGGYNGYFEGPIVSNGQSITARLEVSAGFAPSGGPLTAVVQLVDNSGNYGNQVSVTLPSITPSTRAETKAGSQFRVRGTATYEDFAQTEQGLAKTSTALPIRFAQVEVRAAGNDRLLMRGSTGQDGNFDITFNSQAQRYKVLIWARQDSTLLTQSVHDNREKVYHVASRNIDGRSQPDATVNVYATLAKGGPAFNIFDMGVDGAAFIRRVYGSKPPALTWLWTSGKPGTCGGGASCYYNDKKLISVLSIPADRDEYDDTVLLHEYGHFWQSQYSGDDSPGGSHSSANRVNPLLAFGEGTATFFGNWVKGTAIYLDTNATGVGVRTDLEDPADDVPRGTSDGTIRGDLSETIVGAIPWRMAASRNGNSLFLGKPDSVFQALNYFRSPKFADRGVKGADLVDYLDGWFCLGFDNRGDATSGVTGIVGLYDFPYDFPSLPSCR